LTYVVLDREKWYLQLSFPSVKHPLLSFIFLGSLLQVFTVVKKQCGIGWDKMWSG